MKNGFPVRGRIQWILDTLALPLRTVLLKEEWVERLGLTSLQQERIRAVWPHLRGRLLDVGAGNNRLVKLYGDGVGVDVHLSGEHVMVVDTTHLPFPAESFDTVSFLACLNHISARREALKEAWRVLRPGGQCVLTMINPVIGFINHKLCWYEESHYREVADGERDGLWRGEVIDLLRGTGFQIQTIDRFFYGLNSVFVASK